MPDILPQQRPSRTLRLFDGAMPVSILRRPGQPAWCSDGRKGWTAGCLGCIDRPCMVYAPAELTFAAVPDFPASPEDAVCPTSAMTWDSTVGRPKIAADRCIGCGLCAARCPVGAIAVAETASVSDADGGMQSVPDMPESRRRQREQLAALSAASVGGDWVADCDAQVQTVYRRLTQLRYSPDRLVRNVLLALDWRCALRRRGDVNLRMDALLSHGDTVGAVEVAFHADILEPPRALLDDIAVLHARYGLDKDAILPLVVPLELPNARTEYWQVMADIADVLGIRIRTVTLGALLLLLWQGKGLDLSGDEAILRQERRSLQPFLRQAGVTTALPPGCRSMLEPEK